MTEQQTNNIDHQSLDPDDFVTIGDYWKAWIKQYRQDKEIARISTKSLIEYEKGDLLDLIDKLYQNNQQIWESYTQTMYQLADNTLTGQTLTTGEQQRRKQDVDDHQSTSTVNDDKLKWFRWSTR